MRLLAKMRAAPLGFALALAVGLIPMTAAASSPSGQRGFGQATVEPAVDNATGDTVFLLTPDKVPFPSQSNPRASAPMDIPMYPTGTGVIAADLNCQPTNCDHLNVLPGPLVTALGLQSVYPLSSGSSSLCQHFDPFVGLPAGTPCAAIKGHDHLIGVKPTGDFNVAWHVRLWLFTQNPSTRFTTLADLQKSGIVIGPIDTPITFNCSIVSATVYANATPLSF